MKLSTVLFILCFSVYSGQVEAQAPYFVEFTKTFGTPSCTELGMDVLQDSFGKYYLFSGNTCVSDYGWIIKTDPQCNMVWDKKGIVGDGYSKFTADGKIIHLRPSIRDSVRVIKSDTSGTVIWKKSYFFPLCNNWGRDIVQTSDGGYALTGYFSSVSCSSGLGITYDGFLLKLDANGNQQWSKTYGGSLNEQLFIVKQMPDNGYALFGWHGYGGSGAKWYYLIRTDPNGDTLWTRKYTDAAGSPDYGFGMDRANDGGFVLIGYTLSGYGFSDKTKVYKVDSTGNVQWSKKYSRNGGGILTQIISTSDGGYAYITVENPGNLVISAFVKLDGSGNVLWKDYASDSLTYFRKLRETSDGGFIVTGSTPGNSDVLLIKYARKDPPQGGGSTLGPKISWNGTPKEHTTTGLEDRFSSFTIYPNPAKDVLYLKFENEVNEVMQLQILNSQSQVILNQQIQSSGTVQVDISSLTRGFYLLKISGESGHVLERVVVE